jgi:hypothetical protein
MQRVQEAVMYVYLQRDVYLYVYVQREGEGDREVSIVPKFTI